MIEIREQVPLAPLTTFGAGGLARFFAQAHSHEDVEEALTFARERDLPLAVIGGGSNLLVADDGFDGLVLHMAIDGITVEERDDSVDVTAGAGCIWDGLAAWSVERGLAGFECLSGVPGTVGGAVVQNIGAYGVQASDTLVSVRAIERDSRASRMFTSEECGFAYHHSVFAEDPGRYIVINATFRLPRRETAIIPYEDYRFPIASGTHTLAAVRTAVLAMRREKGSLIGAGKDSFQSAGSFFHMPDVSAEAYEHIREAAVALDAAKEERLRPWAWLQPDGSYRIAPGFLLEFTEFTKGYARGAVGISPKHTLTIINRGNARAADIAALARDMQDAVERLFSIRLEREVVYVGAVERCA